MEGFLFKKALGESTFGRHNWKLRWFVLESTSLSYFESFDSTGNKPADVKGIYPISGATVSDATHPEFKHAFVVQHKDKNPLILAAETANLKALWEKAIKDSSKLEPGEYHGKESPDKYMKTLGIPNGPSDYPTHSGHRTGRTLSSVGDEELESVFKFKALQNDPQHGGKQEDFDKIHDAYNMLVQLKKYREEDKKHVLVHFSAKIKKGPPGEGFGMVVNVDERHNIFVKKVLPCIDLSEATHNAHGEVRVNDEVLVIDGEATEGWTLARLVQRLNDFRVPVGNSVTIGFQRRVRIGDDELDDLEGEDAVEVKKMKKEKKAVKQKAREEPLPPIVVATVAASAANEDLQEPVEEEGGRNPGMIKSDDEFDDDRDNGAASPPQEEPVVEEEHTVEAEPVVKPVAESSRSAPSPPPSAPPSMPSSPILVHSTPPLVPIIAPSSPEPERVYERDVNQLAAASAQFHALQEQPTAGETEIEELRRENELLREELRTETELREQAEKDLKDALINTEKYFVAATRLDEAMQCTADSENWQVPEKMDLNDISAAEKLVAVEHRLLKIGLRVEEDPADGTRYEDLLLPMSVADQERAYKNGEDIFDAPETPQGASPNKYAPGDNGVGAFEFSEQGFWNEEETSHDDDDDHKNHSMHALSESKGVSSAASWGGEEKRRVPDAPMADYMDSPISATTRHRKQSTAQHLKDKYGDRDEDEKHTFTVSVAWGQSPEAKPAADQRRRQNKKYGDGKTHFDNPFMARVSPTLNMASKEGYAKCVRMNSGVEVFGERGFGATVGSPRAVTAKDRIRIKDELDPMKPVKRAGARGRSPVRERGGEAGRSSSRGRSMSPTLAASMLASTTKNKEKLGTMVKKNEEKRKKNNETLPKHTPSKRIQKEDMSGIQALLGKRGI